MEFFRYLRGGTSTGKMGEKKGEEHTCAGKWVKKTSEVVGGLLQVL